GRALRAKNSFHWIVVRSTVLPGTTESVILPAIEAASGMTAGRDFQVCFNPEFLREGTAEADFFNPPFTVIGADNPAQALPVRELYGFSGGLNVRDRHSGSRDDQVQLQRISCFEDSLCQ